MNTIMPGVTGCNCCGKAIRWLECTNCSGKMIAVEAETTAPEDTIFDGKRHVPHRARCTGEMTLVKKNV